MWWCTIIFIVAEEEGKEGFGFTLTFRVILTGDYLSLQENCQKMTQNFKLSTEWKKITFQELVEIVSPHIQRQNSNMRECVSAAERIMITLR